MSYVGPLPLPVRPRRVYCEGHVPLMPNSPWFGGVCPICGGGIIGFGNISVPSTLDGERLPTRRTDLRIGIVDALRPEEV